MAHTQSRWDIATGNGRRRLSGAVRMVTGGVALLTFLAFVSPASTAQSGPGTARAPAGITKGEATDAVDDRPNIMVIYTDDMRASDLDVMTTVNEEIAGNGVTFRNSIVSTSACCPARATHLTGQYAHNTGVLHNSPPYGGYPAFKNGKQKAGETLPIWLQNAGYRTVFFGKYMNHYPGTRRRYEIPPGFHDWYGLFEGPVRGTPRSIYRQTRYAVRVSPDDGRPALLDAARARAVVRAPGGDNGHVFIYDGTRQHQTEVLMDGAINAVERHDGTAPLYLNVWLTAPHTGGDGPVIGGGGYPRKVRPYTVRPAAPELRELKSQLRSGAGLGAFGFDKPPSFNERDVADKPPSIRNTPRLRRDDVQDIEIRNALRLAALRSVDRKIAELLTAAEQAEQRTGRGTYVVFSSDGGFFLGEHRQPYEKHLYYGAASDVPLVIRGPGIVRGAEVAAPVANIDLAATILEMAGDPGHAPAQIDGRSLMPLLENPAHAAASPSWSDRALLLERFWGRTTTPRYSAVRTGTHLYVEHYARSDGETVEFRELYDLIGDPHYQDNLLHGDVPVRSRAVARRLRDVLVGLRTCSGRQCDQRVRPSQPPAGRAAPTTPVPYSTISGQ